MMMMIIINSNERKKKGFPLRKYDDIYKRNESNNKEVN